MQQKVWSKFPRETYTVTVEGRMTGLGINPFLTMPGTWNILWLTAREVVETLIGWSGPQDQFPFDMAAVPAVVGTSVQLTKQFDTVGMLAERLTPKEFLDELKVQQIKPLLEYRFGEVWWELAAENAKHYSPFGPNILLGDFGKNARIQ